MVVGDMLSFVEIRKLDVNFVPDLVVPPYIVVVLRKVAVSLDPLSPLHLFLLLQVLDCVLAVYFPSE